jgi:hypothetical protein
VGVDGNPQIDLNDIIRTKKWSSGRVVRNRWMISYTFSILDGLNGQVRFSKINLAVTELTQIT